MKRLALEREFVVLELKTAFRTLTSLYTGSILDR
jgi:hypothetical protein